MNRTVTENERRLMTHVSMFGSAGYPVRKMGARWVWGTDEVKGPPVCFKTKRLAVESFELFLGVLREAIGQEAQARAIADLKARGYSDAEVREAIAAAHRAAA